MFQKKTFHEFTNFCELKSFLGNIVEEISLVTNKLNDFIIFTYFNILRNFEFLIH